MLVPMKWARLGEQMGEKRKTAKKAWASNGRANF